MSRDRLPPGQYLTTELPVLHIGSIPTFDPATWDLRLTGLLSSPLTLSHEAFTELLRAVFHLKEALLHRTGFVELPEADIRHLAGDAGRVYPLLARQWLQHLEYLRKNYPYLFSLAVRTNPFSENSSVVIR